MIAPAEINSIATKAARAHLSKKTVQRVFSEPTIDSRGEGALRVTIVVAPNAVEEIEGDALLETLVQIQQDLQRAGEERLAIVDYATEAELADASTEP